MSAALGLWLLWAGRWASLAAPAEAVRRAALAAVGARCDGEELWRALLRGGDYRLRAIAARGLRGAGTPAAREALLAALRRAEDPEERELLVAALLPYGREAYEAVRARGRAPDATPAERAAWREFLWQLVVARMRRILKENTNAAGDFKGFYDGQFAPVAAVGPEAASVLLTILAGADRFPLTLRQLAVRAMPAVGGPEQAAVLRAFHDRLADRLQGDDPLQPEQPEQVLLRYARYALARMGDPEPSRLQIRFLRTRLMLYAGQPEIASLYQWELAYEYHQMRDFTRALQEYRRYLEAYPARELRFGNSRHYAWYNMACIEALRGRTAAALRYLDAALKEHFTDFAWLAVDRDLESLRGLPAFRELVARYRARALKEAPPR